MSQLVLPSKIKFVANFSYITAKGNYFYFIANKPFNNTLDLSFSKKFLNDQLYVSINLDDVLIPINLSLWLSILRYCLIINWILVVLDLVSITRFQQKINWLKKLLFY